MWCAILNCDLFCMFNVTRAEQLSDSVKDPCSPQERRAWQLTLARRLFGAKRGIPCLPDGRTMQSLSKKSSHKRRAPDGSITRPKSNESWRWKSPNKSWLCLSSQLELSHQTKPIFVVACAIYTGWLETVDSFSKHHHFDCFTSQSWARF